MDCSQCLSSLLPSPPIVSPRPCPPLPRPQPRPPCPSAHISPAPLSSPFLQVGGSFKPLFLRKRSRFSSVLALDSNQHDTADRSDAASDESKQDSTAEDEVGSIVGLPPQAMGTRTHDALDVAPAVVLRDDAEIDMEGCVLGMDLEAGVWDGGSIGAPVVRRYLSDDMERWLMWYSGKPADGSGSSEGSQSKEVMGLAISSNGLHWKRGDGTVGGNSDVGNVLACSTNWWAFDTDFVRPSDVLVMSALKGVVTAGVYWMYYTGGCSEKFEFTKPNNLPPNQVEFEYFDDVTVVTKTRPGLALSHDGRGWARIEGDHHSGSLFDVGDEKWDSLFVAAPHVVYVGVEDLRMYYHSFDQKSGCFSIGYARSRDGINWFKYGKILGGGPQGSFDELGVKCSQVISHPEGNGYLMVYEGVAADGSSSFGLAQSQDGLSKWQRCGDDPVFTAADKDNAWDSRQVHSPCLVHMDGKEWRLFYQGVDKTGRGRIGMAISTDGKLQHFQRCHGLQL